KQKGIEDVSFRVAVIYADANDQARAAPAFESFIHRYPTSTRVVEAETRAGRAYLAAGRAKQAGAGPNQAPAVGEKLKKPQQKEAARWAAEARYLQGEAVFQQYQAIGLDVKPAALKKAMDGKKALLAKAQTIYTDVVSYGDPTWATAALYRIGQIYE